MSLILSFSGNIGIGEGCGELFLEDVAQLKKTEQRRVGVSQLGRKVTGDIECRSETCLISLVVKDGKMMIPNQLRSKSTVDKVYHWYAIGYLDIGVRLGLRVHDLSLPSMIRTLDVQQPFAQDPTEESTCHIVLLEDLGVVENVLDGDGVGDHDTRSLLSKRNVGGVIFSRDMQAK